MLNAEKSLPEAGRRSGGKHLMFLLAFIIFFSTLQINSQQAQYGFFDKYYIGVLGNGIQHDYSKFSGMNLSLWHKYPNWCCGSGDIDKGWTDWTSYDILTGTYSQYGSVIEGILSTNGGYNFRTVMDRVKIVRLCYGQRSEYQCENQL